MKEKFYPIFRYISIFTEFVLGFIQPYFFNRYLKVEDFAFLTILYGCLIYFVFLDGGISRLAYSNLRKKFVNNIPIRNELIETLSFYNSLIIILIIVFLFFCLSLSFNFQNNITLLVLILFSFLTGFNIVFSYFRQIYNALDKYIFYEKIDILRKSANILGVFFIKYDKTLLTTVTFSLFVIIILYVILVFNLIKFSGIDWINIFPKRKTVFVVFKKYKTDINRIVVFSICEAIIYNCGFILMPMYLNHSGVIQFGIWMKIFTGMAVFMRSFADINIHSITKYYFQGNYQYALRKFYLTLFISITFSICILTLFVFLQKLFFSYWVGIKYIFDINLLIALSIFLLGNSIQHVSGSFLLSESVELAFMRKMSFVLSIIIVAQIFLSLKIYKKLDLTLIFFSIIYFIGSLFYLNVVLKKIKVNT